MLRKMHFMWCEGDKLEAKIYTNVVPKVAQKALQTQLQSVFLESFLGELTPAGPHSPVTPPSK